MTPVAWAAVAVWTAWVFVNQRVALNGWRSIARGLAAVNPGDLAWEAVPVSLGRHVLLVAVSLLIGLACVRAGLPLLRFGRGPGCGLPAFGRSDSRPGAAPDTVTRPALALLLGYLVFGTGFLGAGLAGLFYPGVLLGAVAAALLLRGRTGLGYVRFRPPGWFLAVAAPAGVAAVWMLVPSIYVDVYAYHLAAPEWFLRAHRFALEGAPFGFQVPLTAELVDALAVAAGWDALPHWVHVLPAIAAMSLLAGVAARQGGRDASWLAVAVMLTLGLMVQQAIVAKNSLPAAAYPAAAAACAVRGLWGADPGRRKGWLAVSALLFGGGAAMKWSGFPYTAAGAVATAVLAARRGVLRWKAAMGWVALAAIPILPWLAKSWAFMGDPLYPFLSGWIPGALWDEPSARAVAAFRGPGLTGPSAAGVLAGFASFLRTNQPGFAVILPAAAVAGCIRDPATRWLAAFAGASWVLLWGLFPGEAPRLGLAGWWIWAAVASGGAVVISAGWSPGVRGAALAVLAAGGWLALGGEAAPYVLPAPGIRYLTGTTDQRQFLAEALSTYGEAARALGSRKDVRGVIALAEERSYRLPGRVMSGRFYGRNPAWTLARESRTRGELRRRLRQLSCRHVLYNLVTEGFPHAYSRPFEWDDRMLALWRDFVGRDLVIAAHPQHSDHLNGAFCLYELRDRPLPSNPPHLPYLPGIESRYYAVTRFGLEGDPVGWTRAALYLLERVPNVDYVSDMVGDGLVVMRDWPGAYRFYAVGISHGTVDDDNWWEMGLAAAETGRYEEAFRYVQRAVEISPYLASDAEKVFAELRRVQAAREGIREDGIPGGGR